MAEARSARSRSDQRSRWVRAGLLRRRSARPTDKTEVPFYGSSRRHCRSLTSVSPQATRVISPAMIEESFEKSTSFRDTIHTGAGRSAFVFLSEWIINDANPG